MTMLANHADELVALLNHAAPVASQANTRADLGDVATWNAANPTHLKGPDGKWADVPDVGPGAVSDKLKGAGRIDLEPGERLLRSDRVRGEFGRAWLAVVERDGRKSLRIGLGNATFGTRNDGNGPWRAAEDRSREINEERQELREEREDLENDIEDLEADPDADPADLEARRAQLEELQNADLDEVFPNGHTAILDERGATQLRETLAKALDEGAQLQAELDKPYQELDRLRLQRDKLKAIGRKWTDEEEAEWDRLTAEISRAKAELDELDPLSGPDRPESGWWTFAEGSIPGQWADVHYDIYLDDPSVGVEVKLGAVPHGSDLDFDDMRGAEMTASLGVDEAGDLVRLLAKMESGTEKLGTARSARARTRADVSSVAEWNAAHPDNLKGADGKWADVPGVSAADKLKLGKLAPAGFTVRSSKKIKTDTADIGVAEVDSPDGPQVRVGLITAESGKWDAGFTGEARKAELRKQLAEKQALFDAGDEDADEDEIYELERELEDLDNERTAVLSPEVTGDLRRQLAEATVLAKANKAKQDATQKAFEALEERIDDLADEFSDPGLERRIQKAQSHLGSLEHRLRLVRADPKYAHYIPEAEADVAEAKRGLEPLLDRRAALMPPDARIQLEDLERQRSALTEGDIDDIITSVEVSAPNGARVRAEIWGSDDIDTDWMDARLYVLRPGEARDDANDREDHASFRGLRGLNKLIAGFELADEEKTTRRFLSRFERAAGPKATHAGLAVLASDTGRVLMLQRALDDTDPAGGAWEFPGGSIEDGETPLDAAKREWSEETGCVLPPGEVTGEWRSGIYSGYVWTVADEAAVEVFGDRDDVTNPDDPGGDQIEALAWFDPSQITGSNPGLREELRQSVPKVLAALGGPERERQATRVTADLIAEVKTLIRSVDPDWDESKAKRDRKGRFAEKNVVQVLSELDELMEKLAGLRKHMNSDQREAVDEALTQLDGVAKERRDTHDAGGLDYFELESALGHAVELSAWPSGPTVDINAPNIDLAMTIDEAERLAEELDELVELRSTAGADPLRILGIRSVPLDDGFSLQVVRRNDDLFEFTVFDFDGDVTGSTSIYGVEEVAQFTDALEELAETSSNGTARDATPERSAARRRRSAKVICRRMQRRAGAVDEHGNLHSPSDGRFVSKAGVARTGVLGGVLDKLAALRERLGDDDRSELDQVMDRLRGLESSDVDDDDLIEDEDEDEPAMRFESYAAGDVDLNYYEDGSISISWGEGEGGRNLDSPQQAREVADLFDAVASTPDRPGVPNGTLIAEATTPDGKWKVARWGGGTSGNLYELGDPESVMDDDPGPYVNLALEDTKSDEARDFAAMLREIAQMAEAHLATVGPVVRATASPMLRMSGVADEHGYLHSPQDGKFVANPGGVSAFKAWRKVNDPLLVMLKQHNSADFVGSGRVGDLDEFGVNIVAEQDSGGDRYFSMANGTWADGVEVDDYAILAEEQIPQLRQVLPDAAVAAAAGRPFDRVIHGEDNGDVRVSVNQGDPNVHVAAYSWSTASREEDAIEERDQNRAEWLKDLELFRAGWDPVLDKEQFLGRWPTRADFASDSEFDAYLDYGGFETGEEFAQFATASPFERETFDETLPEFAPIPAAVLSAGQVGELIAAVERLASAPPYRDVKAQPGDTARTGTALLTRAAGVVDKHGHLHSPDDGKFVSKSGVGAGIGRASQQIVDFFRSPTYKKVSQRGHIALDLVGLAPGFGEPFDLANAAWYLAERRPKNAFLSLGSAVPGFGYGTAVIKVLKHIRTARALIDVRRTAKAAKAAAATRSAARQALGVPLDGSHDEQLVAEMRKRWGADPRPWAVLHAHLTQRAGRSRADQATGALFVAANGVDALDGNTARTSAAIAAASIVDCLAGHTYTRSQTQARDVWLDRGADQSGSAGAEQLAVSIVDSLAAHVYSAEQWNARADWLARSYLSTYLRGRFDIRWPKGSKLGGKGVGGRWMDVGGVFESWVGGGEDPFEQFDEPRLAAIAKGLGVNPPEGASKKQLKAILHGKAVQHVNDNAATPGSNPAVKKSAVAAKKAAVSARRPKSVPGAPAERAGIPSYTPPVSLSVEERDRAQRLVRKDPQIWASVHDRYGNISNSGNLSPDDAAWLQSVFEREPAFINRLAQTRQIDANLRADAKKAGQTPAVYKKAAAARLAGLLAGKPVAVRVRDYAALRAILAPGGRFKTSFDTGVKRAPHLGVNLDARRMGEQVHGIDPSTPNEKRPVYGYVAINGVEPALAEGKKIPGIAQREGQEDQLSAYGKVQVVLKPDVAARTTVTVGDSLDEIGWVRPTPLTNPGPESLGNWDVDEMRKPGWTRMAYVEAQIHGGVRADDIAEVVFPSDPDMDTEKALANAGVPWRVLTPTGLGKSSATQAAKPSAAAAEPSSRSRRYGGPVWSLPSSVSQAEFDEFKRLDAAINTADGNRFHGRWLELRDKLPEDAQKRAKLELGIEHEIESFRENLTGQTPTPDQLRTLMTEEVQKAFEGKKVAVRVTPKGLAKMLDDGRFKTQFEGGKTTGGTKDQQTKRQFEQLLFGIPTAGFDPKKRPVYGYVAVNGTDGVKDDDRLNQYGTVQVVLKDEVRDRTTAMFGDSLGDAGSARPSPVNNPDFWSYRPDFESYYPRRSGPIAKDTSAPDFRRSSYAEAQIHGGVSVSDIEEVVFASDPPGDVVRRLDRSGVKWRVTK